MKVTIESTSKIVTLQLGGVDVPARVWQGQTESGVPVQCFITRIAPEIPRDDARQSQFERELQQQADPRPTVQAIPLRFFIG